MEREHEKREEAPAHNAGKGVAGSPSQPTGHSRAKPGLAEVPESTTAGGCQLTELHVQLLSGRVISAAHFHGCNGKMECG